MKKRISILGSTGSIGRQALEVIRALKDKFEIIALTGGANIDLLNEQIAEFKPKYAYSTKKEAIIGAEYLPLEEICSNKENDIILVAVSGKIGLKPTITAINNGIDIALANKETLVMAGDIVMPLAKEKGVKLLLPVDTVIAAPMCTATGMIANQYCPKGITGYWKSTYAPYCDGNHYVPSAPSTPSATPEYGTGGNTGTGNTGWVDPNAGNTGGWVDPNAGGSTGGDTGGWVDPNAGGTAGGDTGAGGTVDPNAGGTGGDAGTGETW